jgi:hypothetical protein
VASSIIWFGRAPNAFKSLQEKKTNNLKPNFEFSATDDSRHMYNNLHRKIKRKPNSNLFFLFFLSSILVHDEHPKILQRRWPVFFFTTEKLQLSPLRLATKLAL